MEKQARIIVQNNIENFGIRLFTNGDSGSYQMLDISFGSFGISRRTFSVAPIDFADIINAIMYSKDISEFLEAVEDTWVAGRLNGMISEIIDEVEDL